MLKTLVLLLLMGACWTVEPGASAPPSSEPDAHELTGDEIVPSIHAIMSQAAALGMPTAIGATLYSGQLTSPHHLRFSHAAIATAPAPIHARLPDGSWLVDMWDPVPAEQLDPGEIAALHALPAAQLAQYGIVDVLNRFPWRNGIMRYANLMQSGVAAAPQALIEDVQRHRDDLMLATQAIAPYPREALGRTPESCLRLVCRWWFLTRLEQEPGATRWAAAALAIAPPAWHQGTAEGLARRAAALAALAVRPGATSAREQLRAWIPEGELGIDNLLLPSLDDATLVGLAGDLTTARSFGPETATVGDRALFILGERWGMDPALCAGRDPGAAWDDAEQAALAQGLQAWWTRTAGQAWTARFASIAGTLSVHDLVQALEHRAEQRQSQQWSVADRLRNRTYQGAAPVAYPNDLQALQDAIAQALAAAWQKPPAAATPEDLMRLLMQFQSSPAWDETVSFWPRTGRFAGVMAAWDDERGQPAGVDALVAAWLSHPLRDEPALRVMDRSGTTAPDPAALRAAFTTPLAWWVAHGRPERWTALQALLSAPVSAPATARLLAGCGQYWFPPQLSSMEGVNLSAALIFATLDDERPLSQALTAYLVRSMRERWLTDDPSPQSPRTLAGTRNAAALPAADLRVCDFVLFQAIANMSVDRELFAKDPTLQLATIASPLAERDRVIAAVRTALQPEAERVLHDLQNPPQVQMRWGVAQPPPVPVVPAIPGGMTADEARACTAVLVQARALGLPDLHGAQVVSAHLRGAGRSSWYGLHLHLADGTWLADGFLPLAAAQVTESGPPVTPAARSRPGMSQVLSRLVGPDQDRYLANAVVTSDLEQEHGLGMAALAWWSGGADPTGMSVVDACLLEAAGQGQTACIFPTDGYRGGADTSGTAEVPDLAIGVRRILARWFCDQLALATTVPEAARWAGAARAILVAADHPAWEVLIGRLQQRVAIPLVVAPTADLPARLASWGEELNESRTGRWSQPGPPPATRADSAALIALLADPRPSRWVLSGIPMTLGDVALRALNQRWGFDWRWIVLSDPQVGSCFPATHASRAEADDQWRLVSANWTDQARVAVAQALQAWWTLTGSHSAAAPVLAALDRAPLQVWPDILPTMPRELLDGAAAGVVARRLAQQPGVDDRIVGTDVLVMAALAFPSDPQLSAVLAAWPSSTVLRTIAIMRAGVAGDDARLDRWFAGPLAGRGLPPPTDRGNETPEERLSAWMNLGLIVYRPTPARLAALRATLNGDLHRPSTLWLLSCVGCRYYPLTSHLEELLCQSDEERAACIPAQLALDGLSDTREIPAASVALLVQLSRMSFGDAEDLSHCPQPRVCDQVGARLLSWAHHFNRSWNPPLIHQDDAFLAEPPSQRDRDLLALKVSFLPIIAASLGRMTATAPQR